MNLGKNLHFIENYRKKCCTSFLIFSGIAILYQIPRKQAPSTFSFMAPFGNDVWFLLGITYLLVSVCIVVIRKIPCSLIRRKIPCSRQFGIMMIFFLSIRCVSSSLAEYRHLNGRIHVKYTRQNSYRINLVLQIRFGLPPVPYYSRVQKLKSSKYHKMCWTN